MRHSAVRSSGRGADAPHHAQGPHVDRLTPVVVGQVLEPATGSGTGGVHEDVELAPALVDGAERRLDLVGLRDVGAQPDRVGAAGAQLLAGLVERRLRARHHRDAVLREHSAAARPMPCVPPCTTAVASRSPRSTLRPFVPSSRCRREGSRRVRRRRDSRKPGAPLTEDTTAPPDPRLEHMLRGTLLSWWAEQQPDRLAVAGAHGQRTFAELDRRANQLVRAAPPRRRAGLGGRAHAAQSRGVGRGVGGVRGGYRLTPINWHLTGPEAGYIVDDCGATTFVAGAATPVPRRTPPAPHPGRGAAGGRRRHRGLRTLRGRRHRRGRRPARRCHSGRPDALHVGHHRPPQGRGAPGAARHSRSRTRRPSPSPRSSATSPATYTCAAGRCTRRRSPSRSHCRSCTAWGSCSWTRGTRRTRCGSCRSTA